jgi:hypothetical protein
MARTYQLRISIRYQTTNAMICLLLLSDFSGEILILAKKNAMGEEADKTLF